MAGSISPGSPEAQEDVAAAREGEASHCQGGAGYIPAKTLEPITLAGGYSHRGVQGEALDIPAKRRGESCGRVQDRCTEPAQASASFRLQGDATLHRGGGDQGQEGGLLVGVRGLVEQAVAMPRRAI